MSAAGPRTTQPATLVMVVASLVLLAAVGLPLWQPLLIAAVLAGTLNRWHEKLARKVGDRRLLVSLLFTLGTVLLILLPIAALGLVAVHEAVGAATSLRETLQSSGVDGLIEKAPTPFAGWLQSLQGHLPGQLDAMGSQLSSGGKWALETLTGTLGAVANGAFQLTMMLIALFFLLRDGPQLVDWLARVTPLGPSRVRELMGEFRDVAKSVLGANFITGAVQSVVATAGYFIAQAPSPIFFGLLTLFASLIPSVGTALVALPLTGMLLLLGHPWAALFLGLWSLIVVGLVDNFLRPLLIRGQTPMHGALVFFALIGGISTFGMVGMFLGPLALAFFLTSVRIARRPPLAIEPAEQ